MSRVGVKTLLTWYRTIPFWYKISDKSLTWTWAANLYVRFTEKQYSIHYQDLDYNYEIDLIQLVDIMLIYQDITGVYYLTYRDGGLIENKINLTYKLLSIPVTNIFDMFPIVINIANNYYKSKPLLTEDRQLNLF